MKKKGNDLDKGKIFSTLLVFFSVVVKKSMRGKGLGKLLMKETEQFAKRYDIFIEKTSCFDMIHLL